MIASPGASYYTIAVILVDQEHLVQKCVGGDTRTPGKSMRNNAVQHYSLRS